MKHANFEGPETSILLLYPGIIHANLAQYFRSGKKSLSKGVDELYRLDRWEGDSGEEGVEINQSLRPDLEKYQFSPKVKVKSKSIFCLNLK